MLPKKRVFRASTTFRCAAGARGRGCAGTNGSGNHTKLNPTLNELLSSHLYSTNTLPEPYYNSFLLKLVNLDILPVKIACGRGCSGMGGSGNRTKLSPTLNKMLSSHLYSTNTLPTPYNSYFLLKLANLDILPVKIACGCGCAGTGGSGNRTKLSPTQGQKDFAACTKPRNFQFSATNRDFLRFPRQIAKFPILRDKSRFFQSSAKNCAFSFKSEDQICAFSFKSEDQICAFSFKSEDQVCVFSIKSAGQMSRFLQVLSN